MSTAVQSFPGGLGVSLFPWAKPESASPAAAAPATKPRAMEDAGRKLDDALVARTQAGDAAAFDELVVKYSPRLYGLVYNMTSNHEDTNDLLQDIFSKAYKSIGGVPGQSPFYNLIHSLAVHFTLNFLKKRGRRLHLSLPHMERDQHN